jgi:hypothetical protein
MEFVKRERDNVLQSIHGKSSKLMKSRVKVVLSMNACPADPGELSASILMLALTPVPIDCIYNTLAHLALQFSASDLYK